MPDVRLIDANAAADQIMRELETNVNEADIGTGAIMIAFAKMIRDKTIFPTIEPRVRHGQWRIIDNDWNCWRCTCCGEEWVLNDGNPSDNGMMFCPHCGARMDGGDDNEK